METRHYILATAGHVDHGKSGLVKALTGTDPDRLPEEKARGITIDLGFAHLELDPPGPEPAQLSVGVVDVPGHEDFVRNMVAGVGSIDAALLVVAADDGWMPQTEEHCQILGFLGVTRAVVALTKIDLAEGREAARLTEVREHLLGTPFAEAPIVPTSLVTGQGLPGLRQALGHLLGHTPPPRDAGKPRLAIDRVFVVRGLGTVVTGTLTGGRLARGQTVAIQPSGQTTRIRTLQSHHAEVESCGPGTRTALNLADVEPYSATQPKGVSRGETVTLPGWGSASNTWDVLLSRPRTTRTNGTGRERRLKEGVRVWIHHGSGHHAARVLFLERPASNAAGANGGDIDRVDPAEPGDDQPLEPQHAQLRFEQPVFGCVGDRFVVRDWAESETLAGGVVLEAQAWRKHWRSARYRTFLQAVRSGWEDAGRLLGAVLERDHWIAREGCLNQTHFSKSEVQAGWECLRASGRARPVGDWLADPAWWATLVAKAADEVDKAHREHPERAGLEIDDLRVALAGSLPADAVFDLLVEELEAHGIERAGHTLRRTGYHPSLPAHLHAAGTRLRRLLAAKPFDPPSRKELAPDAITQQALRYLIETGEATELDAAVVLSAQALQGLTALVVGELRRRGSATVSDLRQAVGSSRRIMIPLLERLDREGVTRREGDLRRLGRNAPG